MALHEGRPRAGILLIATAAALAAALLIEAAGAPAARQLPSLAIPHADKLLHFAAHFFLTLVALMGLLLCGRSSRFATPAAVALSAVIGLVVELLQSGPGAAFGRTFDALDIAANMAGALLAAWLGLAVARRARVAYNAGKSGG